MEGWMSVDGKKEFNEWNGWLHVPQSTEIIAWFFCFVVSFLSLLPLPRWYDELCLHSVTAGCEEQRWEESERPHQITRGMTGDDEDLDDNENEENGETR